MACCCVLLDVLEQAYGWSGQDAFLIGEAISAYHLVAETHIEDYHDWITLPISGWDAFAVKLTTVILEAY